MNSPVKSFFFFFFYGIIEDFHVFNLRINLFSLGPFWLRFVSSTQCSSRES